MPVAFRIRTYGLELETGAYARRLLALASSREWEAAALAEPWREPAPEREAEAAGTRLRDLRRGE